MKLTKLRTSIFSVLLLLTVVFYTACDNALVTSLRVALAASQPLVQSLVDAGVLKDQAKATAIINDFNDAAGVAIQLNNDLGQATTKEAKAAAAQKAERDWLVIYRRGDFGANPQVLRAANIADGIFSSIVLYFGGQPVSMAHVPPSATPKSAGEMKDQIQRQIDLLKETLKAR